MKYTTKPFFISLAICLILSLIGPSCDIYYAWVHLLDLSIRFQSLIGTLIDYLPIMFIVSFVVVTHYNLKNIYENIEKVDDNDYNQLIKEIGYLKLELNTLIQEFEESREE